MWVCRGHGTAVPPTHVKVNILAGKKQNFGLETIKRFFYLLPRRPQRIQIELTNRCNFNCKMCQRPFLGVPYKDIDFELFKKVINKLEGVYEINLTGWGEPLLHPQISEMIEYCHQLGFKTSLTTNASLLNQEMAERIINAGLYEISFSIDNLNRISGWGHIITNQMDNIKEFAFREKRPSIIIQATIHQNGLKDICDIIKFAKEVGAKKINLARLDIRFNKDLVRPNYKEERYIVKQALIFGDKLKIPVDCLPYSFEKGFKRIFYKLFKGWLHQKGRYCLKTFDCAYINVEGSLTPCCSLPLYGLGSFTEENLETLWQSPQFKIFRKNQKKICGKCDVAQIKQK